MTQVSSLWVSAAARLAVSPPASLQRPLPQLKDPEAEAAAPSPNEGPCYGDDSDGRTILAFLQELVGRKTRKPFRSRYVAKKPRCFDQKGESFQKSLRHLQRQREPCCSAGGGGGGSFLCPRLPLLFPLVRIKEPLMGWGANLAFAVSVSEFPAASSGPSAERLVVPAEVCAGPGKSGPGVRLGLLLRRRQGPPPPRAQLLALSFFGFCFATDKKKKNLTPTLEDGNAFKAVFSSQIG